TGALRAPVNLIPPTISGKPQVGKTLTASHGSWTGSPTSYAYRWLRCAPRGSSCAGVGDRRSRRLNSSHVNSSYGVLCLNRHAAAVLRLHVIARNAPPSFPTRRSSDLTGALRAPVNLIPPTISGKPQVGKTLSASHGSWTGSPPSYAYRWLRCAPRGSSCAGVGQERTRTVRQADVGSVLRVKVIARNAAGSSSALSKRTAIVTSGPPLNTSPPVIFGFAQVGKTLTASHGSWTGSPTSYAYRW